MTFSHEPKARDFCCYACKFDFMRRVGKEAYMCCNNLTARRLGLKLVRRARRWLERELTDMDRHPSPEDAVMLRSKLGHGRHGIYAISEVCDKDVIGRSIVAGDFLDVYSRSPFYGRDKKRAMEEKLELMDVCVYTLEQRGKELERQQDSQLTVLATPPVSLTSHQPLSQL